MSSKATSWSVLPGTWPFLPDVIRLMATINPANSPVEGKVVFPMIYRVLYIQKVVVWDFFHQQELWINFKVFFQPSKIVVVYGS